MPQNSVVLDNEFEGDPGADMVVAIKEAVHVCNMYSLIGNHMWALDWNKNRPPRVTLNMRFAVCGTSVHTFNQIFICTVMIKAVLSHL